MGAAFFIAASYFTLNGAFSAFAMYHPFPSFFMAFGLGLFVFGDRFLPLAHKVFFRSGGKWFWTILFFILGTGASAYFAYYFLEAVPHTLDGTVYHMQSKIFASGHLQLKSMKMPEFFEYVFMINDGRYFALFQPLWPAVMAIGTIFGAPWFVNPVLAGFALSFTYLLGRRTLGETVARLGTAFLLVSPLFLGISATMLNHPLCMLLTVMAFFCVVKAHQDRKGWPAVIAGALMGLLFVTRTLDALVTAPLVLGFVVMSVGRNRYGRLHAVWALLAAVSLGSLQFLYNYLQTGGWFYFPQDDYFNMSEPIKNCHRLGFGKGVGCPVIHPLDYFPNGFTPSDAVYVTHRRLSTFVGTTSGYMGFFLLIYAGLGFLRKRSAYRYFFFAQFLALVVGYFFFYFHGVWGRYYYSAIPFLTLLMADSVVGFYGAAQRFGDEKIPKLKSLLSAVPAAVGLCVILFLSLVFVPIFTKELSYHFYGVSSELERQVKAQKLQNAIVFLHPQFYGNGYHMQTTDPESSDVMYVMDLGPHNQNIVNMYPDRKPYIFRMPHWRLEPFDIKPNYDKFTILPAAKPPRVATGGEYASRIWLNNFPRNGHDPNPLDPPEYALTLFGTGVGNYMEFRNYVFKSGMYDVTMRYSVNELSCDFRMIIDGKPAGGLIKGYSKEPYTRSVRLEPSIPLPKGEILFRADIVGKDEQSKGCLVTLLSFELERAGDLPPGAPEEAAPLPPLTKAIHKHANDSSADAMSGDMVYYYYKYKAHYQPHFLLWLLLAIPIIYVVRVRGTARQALVLALSILFLMVLWGAVYGLVLCMVPVAAYWAGGRLYQIKNAAKRKLWLAAAIIALLATYAALLINEQPVLHENRFRFFVIPFLHIAGVAYMVPKLVHYLVERSKGTIKDYDILTTLVYFLYFPTLRLGPVERYPQFRESLIEGCNLRKYNRDDIIYGFYRIGLGVVKSALFLGFFEQFTGTYFYEWQHKHWLYLYLGLYAAVFSVYLDFGGYADFSIGLSRLIGVRLSENFVRPFSSPNLGEWWRRWHMTLATRLREYIYIPLGGSKSGNVYFNYIATFAAVGLWHHISWHFLVWGLAQGLGLCFLRLWKIHWLLVRYKPERHPKLYAPFKVLQSVGDAFPTARLVLAVFITNTFFAFTAVYFGGDVIEATKVLIKIVTLGSYNG